MRFTNDSSGADSNTDPYAQLLRLQSEYQARLVGETLRYLKHLQGVLGPAAPGTVLAPSAELALEGATEPGGRVALDFELENLQRVHCMVSLQLTPLLAESGTTWFPDTEPAAASRLLAPDEVARLGLTVLVPTNAPPGTYRGGLLLLGFHEGTIPVTISVLAPAADAPRRKRRSRAARASGAAKPRRKSAPRPRKPRS